MAEIEVTATGSPPNSEATARDACIADAAATIAIDQPLREAHRMPEALQARPRETQHQVGGCLAGIGEDPTFA